MVEIDTILRIIVRCIHHVENGRRVPCVLFTLPTYCVFLAYFCIFRAFLHFSLKLNVSNQFLAYSDASVRAAGKRDLFLCFVYVREV